MVESSCINVSGWEIILSAALFASFFIVVPVLLRIGERISDAMDRWF